jgi:hypothetical protein
MDITRVQATISCSQAGERSEILKYSLIYREPSGGPKETVKNFCHPGSKSLVKYGHEKNIPQLSQYFHHWDQVDGSPYRRGEFLLTMYVDD